jgi:hypothetical protein
MKPASEIDSRAEAELEQLREAIRDRRWRRHQSMFGHAWRWAALGLLAVSFKDPAMSAFVRFFGL